MLEGTHPATNVRHGRQIRQLIESSGALEGWEPGCMG